MNVYEYLDVGEMITVNFNLNKCYSVFRVLTLNKDYAVITAKRIHLFPFRTQKLSSLAPMVLGGKLPGRVGHSRVIFFILREFVVVDI